MRDLTTLARLSAVFAVAFFVGRAEAQPLKFTPGTANSIILIDVESLHESPLAKREGWAAQNAEDYAAAKCPFPPTTRSAVFVRELDPNGLRTVRREVAILRCSEPITFDRLKQAVGGKVQTIGSRKVVASPRGLLAALLDDKSSVAYFPADRQAFARWLQNAPQAERDQLSPYLAGIAKKWPKSGQVVMALDLGDGVDESAIEEELKNRKDLVANSADASTLAKAFASITGMRLTINVADAIRAEWAIDFSGPIGGASNLLRPFFEGALKRIADPSLDLAKWRMVEVGDSLVFKATLTREQLHGVFESINSPVLTGRTLSRSAPADPAVVEASKRYYRSLSNMLQGLARSADRLADYTQAGAEYERTAARIQRLSTANVDPDLAAFGEESARAVMTMARSLQGVPGTIAEQEDIAWNDRFFYGPSFVNPQWNYPWRWGLQPPIYVGANLTNMAQSNINNTVANESTRRRDDWLRLRERQRQVAAQMTNRYGVDFSAVK